VNPGNAGVTSGRQVCFQEGKYDQSWAMIITVFSSTATPKINQMFLTTTHCNTSE
jgi:hypothetical protein